MSWENDGDNYNTKHVTYEDKEFAIEVARMCRDLFCSINNGGNGIGNSNDEMSERVAEYMREHPILWEYDKKFVEEMEDDEDLAEFCINVYNEELLGYSEWYYSRVCESVTITYSPEDVYLEEIEF